MKIGIKYCGGCNPRYDRGAFFSRLKKEIEEKHEFETAVKGTVYDMVLVLCGCTSCCADHSELEAKEEKILITGEEDYGTLLRKIG
ncbi:hypothetical protein GOM49_11260 [Clostridium bovifaecis]|uniref:Uncharacterized protein n=1 Tax=Clostridium bovifaecis TaxID=2184719 RepID=A0A6I6ETB7_9CLOT|nr:hypothetical protein GOM49_11260 [Clostridium bovifaecis]